MHVNSGDATPRLIVMDVDSTLINEEVIDLLGEEAGIGDRIAAITERAMRGELDFEHALAERMALLAGLPATVLQRVYERVTFTPGARELVAAAHARGWRVGVVSGGFCEIVDLLAEDAGIDFALASRLEIVDGALTGRLLGPVVTRELKLATLERWAREMGIGLDRIVAVGDGANDIPMIQAAGVGIAFCAKPAVRAAAPFHIDERNLLRVLDVVDEADAAGIVKAAGAASAASTGSEAATGPNRA